MSLAEEEELRYVLKMTRRKYYVRHGGKPSRLRNDTETHPGLEDLCVREQPLSGAWAGDGEVALGFV
jgi:hypothetical protein